MHLRMHQWNTKRLSLKLCFSQARAKNLGRAFDLLAKLEKWAYHIEFSPHFWQGGIGRPILRCFIRILSSSPSWLNTNPLSTIFEEDRLCCCIFFITKKIALNMKCFSKEHYLMPPCPVSPFCTSVFGKTLCSLHLVEDGRNQTLAIKGI